MKRRTLLRGVPAAGALALTGCLTSGSGGQATDTASATNGNDDTDSPSEAEGDTPGDTVSEPGDGSDAPDDTVSEPDDGSDTPSDAPTDAGEGASDDPSATPSGVADSSLEVEGSGCGDQTDDASVAFDDSGDAVAVTGTIWGNDACYTAVLSDVSLDGGSLTVTVGAESDAGTDTGCAQCITEIAYAVSVALKGGLPSEVTVVHARGGEDTKVTSVER